MTNLTKGRLRTLFDWQSETTIVPHSGIQMLDFGFNLEGQRIRFDYLEKTTDADSNVDNALLVPLTGDEDVDAPTVASAHPDDPAPYTINERHALNPFLGQWVPVPMLRLRKTRGPDGAERFDPGPSTWARMRVVELDENLGDTSGHTHRVQLALDTALVPENRPNRYLAPDVSDSETTREFRFVSDPNQMAWFLRNQVQDGDVSVDTQMWVSDWISHQFNSYLQAHRRNRPIEEGLSFEHWARYLSYLRVVDQLIDIPLVRLVNTVSERDKVPNAEVDLVLDVGNSRTCGILVEQFPNETRVDLSRSYPLAVRDLSKPELYYKGLLASRVEFAELSFGEDRFAAGSGRRNAFLWPSFVRVGPEALRLIEREEGTETTSGLSSPKRYLWSDDAVQQDWRFHSHKDPNSLPRSARAAMQHLNEAGDVLPQVIDEENKRLRPKNKTSRNRAVRPRFSQSSLFGFMLAEIIAHALVQINDPADRARRWQSDLPRRLRRIMITLPTATPVQEQAIIRSRAAGALHLVWARMEQDGQVPVGASKPELIVDWDEASCTQMVYLYNEITQKYRDRLEGYLNLMGQSRTNPKTGRSEPSIRVCSIDVGGGTTDMMVTTYFAENDRILIPNQNFREGFRIAGDDILGRVISTIVLKAIQADAEGKGGFKVRERLATLFGGTQGGGDERDAQARRQFSLRVLAPLALRIIELAEHTNAGEQISVAAKDVFGLGEPAVNIQPANGRQIDAGLDAIELNVPADLLAYLEQPLQDCGAADWALADLTIQINRDDVDNTVRNVMQGALSNMVEIIDHLACDVVLLTGRPSRLPGLRDIISDAMVLRPDRLVSMHDYRTGIWYPYRDLATQKIGDPKSTVAVGGMLIALSENRVPNFAVQTSAFKMKSTVRFIGEMNEQSKISDRDLIFKDVDLNGGSNDQAAAELLMYNRISIGSRQLPLERWTTTPLYSLDFVKAENMAGRTPIKVTLERRDFDDSPETEEEILRAEALKEAFVLVDAEDNSGAPVKPGAELVLKLHTLGKEDAYWLDTGVFALT